MISRTRELLIGRLRRRKTREREGAFLAEGLRCAGEVLGAGLPVRFAIAAHDLERSSLGASLLGRLEGAGVEVVRVAGEELSRLADTESPQGLLLVAEERRISAEQLTARPFPRLLALDGVQDPGNVGTLIRAAAAFGVDGVVALPGTSDPWNPKCVRASAGLVARVPVAPATWPELLPLLARQRIELLVSDAAGEDAAAVRHAAGWALVMGNEGSGPSSEAREANSRPIAIPMTGGVDSLNVGMAGAILLYVLTRS